MKNNRRAITLSGYIKTLLLLILFFAVSCTVSYAREITDMAGRKVIVPDRIRKVCTDWPIMMYLVYAVDPTLLAGINAPLTRQEQQYLHPHVLKLPVVGGFFGQSATTSMEAFLKAKPDVVIAEMWGNMALNAESEKMLDKLGIPVVYVKIDTTDDYPAAFLFLGNLFGKEKRARMLADYGKDTLKEIAHIVKTIPRAKVPRVYYAEGVTGLFTECHTSFHAELIELAGATNVHHCTNGGFKVKGMEAVSLEQVLLYDPEVIIAAEPSFYKSVLRDSRWQNIRAIKTRRVYLVPRILFNWFDRPPSFMRLLGTRWIAHCLYPDSYRIDMVKEAQQFYRLFLNIEISDDMMRRAIYP
jgi:iron complex transport system substrate-binding protein